MAARVGIYLSATPRLARGAHSRPLANDAYRLQTERLTSDHSADGAAAAAATIVTYARRYQADAGTIAGDDPEAARALKAASDTLGSGAALIEQIDAATWARLSRALELNETIGAVRDAIMGCRKRMDDRVAGYRDDGSTI